MNDYQLATGESADLLLDIGSYPVCHRFLKSCIDNENRIPLKLGIGKGSGLVGLLEKPSWQSLTPIYPWVTCNEPEDHLDDLVGKLSGSLSPSSSILGLSNKDATTLARFEKHGFSNVSTFSHSLLEQQPNPGVEVVQAALSDEIHNQGKQYDVIVGRHILEHTWDTQSFLNNLLKMLTTDGIAVLEVPDNEKAFREKQHTIIWEEHSLYFTEHTLSKLLAEYGLKVRQLFRYSMALEDILVVVLSKEKVESSSQSVDKERPLVEKFCQEFDVQKRFFRDKLLRYRRKERGVALLGAGHLGCAFINYYGLNDLIDVVIDDDPNKQGMFMPGSKLPIKSSATLQDGGYSICLLTCNPWNNEKVKNNHSQFLENSGQFISIFQLEHWDEI